MTTPRDYGDWLQAQLADYGELHLVLDSGAEAHVHVHDTDVVDGLIEIESKRGDWSIRVDRIEHVEYPDSYVAGAE